MSPTNDKVRVPLDQAKEIAADVLALVAPWCVKAELAGSIRRGKNLIGDVEIVFVPRLEPAGIDLFGEPTQPVNLQLEAIKQMIAEGLFEKRVHKDGSTTCGAGAQYLRYRGMNVDLFGVVAPSQFGVIMAIRTGPEPFSHHRLVMPHFKGGMLPTGFRIQDGQLWESGRPLETPDEQTLFDQIGHDYIPPDRREEFGQWGCIE